MFPSNLMLFIVQHCVLLDIEGTTTPVSFVTDVLFSYAHDNVGKHLAATYDSEETQNDINLLRSQVRCFCFLSIPSTL
jgi:methylthioribulose 1-phosphate dehydratase/enolase-phosphatase E1